MRTCQASTRPTFAPESDPHVPAGQAAARHLRIPCPFRCSSPGGMVSMKNFLPDLKEPACMPSSSFTWRRFVASAWFAPDLWPGNIHGGWGGREGGRKYVRPSGRLHQGLFGLPRKPWPRSLGRGPGGKKDVSCHGPNGSADPMGIRERAGLIQWR